MADYCLYDVAVKTLSPLHIGSGVTLLRDYDYAVHDGRTWRLNLDALLDEKADDPAVQARLARTPPAQLLTRGDFVPGSRLFRYVLGGAPRSTREGAQVQEQIKDPWGHPYLPGSSLKGALRTALLSHALTGQPQGAEMYGLGKNPKWAAQAMERDVFGRNPNEDLLRALQVADSEPLGMDCLRLANCQVVSAATLAPPAAPSRGYRPGAGRQGGAGGPPVELEAIRASTTFAVRIKVDEGLFGAWAGRSGLSRHPGRDWLEDLPRIIQAHTVRRVERILARWRREMDNPDLGRFFRAVAKAPEGSCYVQVGWGTGWDGTTIGAILDDRQVDDLVERYRLSRSRNRPAQSPFPASRRMALRPNGRVAGPLGWLRLDFRRRSS